MSSENGCHVIFHLIIHPLDPFKMCLYRLNLRLTGFDDPSRKSPEQRRSYKQHPNITQVQTGSSANCHISHVRTKKTNSRQQQNDLYVLPAASQFICNLTCINISILRRSNPGVQTNEPSTFTSVESVPGACLVSKNLEFSTFTGRNIRKLQPSTNHVKVLSCNAEDFGLQ